MNADIKVKAPRKSVAQDLLSKTRVKMNKSGSESVIDVQRPRTRDNQSIHIDIDIEAPRRLAYRFKTHNGETTVTDVSSVSGKSHNGRIRASDIPGFVDLESHNGSIRCTSVKGPLDLETHNGSVVVHLDEVTGPVCSIETHNGKIDLDAPEDLSARVSVRAHNGSIKLR